jgi:hypothetical protein
LQHFYEKVSTIKIGDRTDFTVVTQEGERVIGFGNIVEVDKWSNRGQYGFKIKISVKKQKSLSDRRIRGPSKIKLSSVQPENMYAAGQRSVVIPPAGLLAAAAAPDTTAVITAQDINNFQEMLKESLTIDMIA